MRSELPFAEAFRLHGQLGDYWEKFEELAEELAEEEGCELEAVYETTVQRLADGSWDPNAEGGAGYYSIDGDWHLGDAPAVLPLPPWARIESLDDGGPGTGFTAVFIVLEPGR